MRQTEGVEAVKPLDDILTAALKQTFPHGTKIADMSFNDKVGTMILLKVVKHLAGSNLPPAIQFQMAMLYATLGASTGVMPTEASTVQLLYKGGN